VVSRFVDRTHAKLPAETITLYRDAGRPGLAAHR
jgi:hypothetical protein